MPQVRRGPFRLGLTGGIGSGKSTVAKYLQLLGADVIDADAVSKAATQAHGQAMPGIARVFGDAFVGSDGSMNRALMRERVFNDPLARAQLEGIVHPIVAQEISRLVAESKADCLVFDIPLLVESPRWRQQLDAVWVVDCLEATQVERVQSRSGWDIATVMSVIASQSARAQRLAASDAVVFNDRLSLAQLHATVKSLAARFGL